MGYNISKSNSKQFKVDDDKLCFGVALGEMGYDFGLYRLTANGEWTCPIWGNENGMIAWNLTSDEIMAHGSVANYIKAQLPLMQAKLSRYLGAALVKPDPADKPGCVGYDLSLDVDFDPASLAFSLNKEPPLSHARD